VGAKGRGTPEGAGVGPAADGACGCYILTKDPVRVRPVAGGERGERKKCGTHEK
jgi:hypothetical protein